MVGTFLVHSPLMETRSSRKPRFHIPGAWEPISKIHARRLKLDLDKVRQFQPEDVTSYYLALKEGAWLEVPLNHEWTVAYRLVIQSGQPVIGEMRVFPFESVKQGAGTWSGEWLGVRAQIPHGGISARLLRQLRAGLVAEQLSEILEGIEQQYGRAIFAPEALLGRLGFPTRSQVEGPRRGRKGRPDLEYARIAAAYVHALRSGNRRPVEAVARSRRIPVPQARDLIHRARVRGLLTFAMKQGRAGGMLTPQAQEVLKTQSMKRRTRHAKR